MNETEYSRVHVWVRGRVQGVGFRAFVEQSAIQMGLKGWVRNVGWDQVEALAEGEKTVLEQFINAMRTGPRASRVEDTRVEWESGSSEFTVFEVKASR